MRAGIAPAPPRPVQPPSSCVSSRSPLLVAVVARCDLRAPRPAPPTVSPGPLDPSRNIPGTPRRATRLGARGDRRSGGTSGAALLDRHGRIPKRPEPPPFVELSDV